MYIILFTEIPTHNCIQVTLNWYKSIQHTVTDDSCIHNN